MNAVVQSRVAVDTSIMLKTILAEPFSAEVERLIGDWDAAGTRMIAPALLAYELTNILYRKVGQQPGVSSLWLRRSIRGVLTSTALVPPDTALSQ